MPKGIVGNTEFTVSSTKFERMVQEAMDKCLRALKESNKSIFDSYRVRNSLLIISYITFRDCRVHMFSGNLTWNSCIHKRQSNKQVFFSLEFVNILLQIEAKAVKNASSLLKFSGHSELENGLLRAQRKRLLCRLWTIISRDPDQASRFCGFLYHVFVGLKSLDVRYYFLSKA